MLCFFSFQKYGIIKNKNPDDTNCQDAKATFSMALVVVVLLNCEAKGQ